MWATLSIKHQPTNILIFSFASRHNCCKFQFLYIYYFMYRINPKKYTSMELTQRVLNREGAMINKYGGIITYNIVKVWSYNTTISIYLLLYMYIFLNCLINMRPVWCIRIIQTTNKIYYPIIRMTPGSVKFPLYSKFNDKK